MTKYRRGIQYLRRRRGRDCIPTKGSRGSHLHQPSEDGAAGCHTRFGHMAMGTLSPASGQLVFRPARRNCPIFAFPAEVGHRDKTRDSHSHKLWKGECRSYSLDAEGKEQSWHKSKTWSRANFTKAEAKAELDALLREQQQGGPKRDGSMTLADFWVTYCRIKAARWTVNTRTQAMYLWEDFIKPAMGAKPLNEITKATIELALIQLAEADRGRAVLEAVRKSAPLHFRGSG